MKKLFVTLIVLAALGWGGWWLYQKALGLTDTTAPESIRTVKAERRDLAEVIEATGFVQPVVATEVKSEISGRIAKVLVRNGDRVERDQILIELDRRTQENALVEAQRNFQAQELRVERARRNFDRQQQLRAKEFGLEREFLDAQTELELAEIELEVLRARLENAKENLERTTIRAPQSGVITDLEVNEGQVIVGASSVNQGMILMKVNDLERLFVEADIFEFNIDRLREGMVANITFDSIPDLEMEGHLDKIPQFAVVRRNARVFPIEIIFEAGGHLIRPGVSANVRIATREAENAVSVIASAVFSDRRERFVFVRKSDGDFEKRPVVLGISDARFQEIKEGLEEGEEVTLMRPPAFR